MWRRESLRTRDLAACRHHHQQSAIFLLNLLLGWTVIGWIAAAYKRGRHGPLWEGQNDYRLPALTEIPCHSLVGRKEQALLSVRPAARFCRA